MSELDKHLDDYEREASQVAGGLREAYVKITKADDRRGTGELGAVKFAAYQVARMIIDRGDDVPYQAGLANRMFATELRLALIELLSGLGLNKSELH